MTISVFILAFFSSVGSYLLISAWLDRRVRAVSLRRLASPGAEAGRRRRSGPALMQMVDDVGGRLATRALDRMRLKQAAEQLLETADLKWGAAGLLHRSTGFFLGLFTLVTLFMHNRQPLVAVGAGALGAWMPVAYVKRKASE